MKKMQKKAKESIKYMKNNKKGITLVALVVTIIVLLILAGITITLLFSENGIIKKAQKAKEETENAVDIETEQISNLAGKINEVIGGNGAGSGGGNPPVDPPKVADNLGKVISETDNTDLIDSYGNKIVVPAGFHIVTTSEDSTVTYSYSGDGVPAVQDGIVIADSDGNQFVWIPVGTITNKGGTTNTIDLARYTFDITLNPDTYEISGGTGAVKNKITDGSALTDEFVEIDGGGYEYLEELSTSTTYANTKAKDIEGFKSSATQKEGYYLARYEASYRSGSSSTDYIPYSKPSTGTPRTSSSTAITQGMLWNYITQPNAAAACRNMYTSSNYESDLMNSYAWDTAIVFIQTYSGDNDYSMQNSLNTTLANTGTNGDKVCNIQDMASNTFEWTTETYTYTRTPCSPRGGGYNGSIYYAARRNGLATTDSDDFFSFRSLLYVK